eukprot:g3730.t1
MESIDETVMQRAKLDTSLEDCAENEKEQIGDILDDNDRDLCSLPLGRETDYDKEDQNGLPWKTLKDPQQNVFPLGMQYAQEMYCLGLEPYCEWRMKNCVYIDGDDSIGLLSNEIRSIIGASHANMPLNEVKRENFMAIADRFIQRLSKHLSGEADLSGNNTLVTVLPEFQQAIDNGSIKPPNQRNFLNGLEQDISSLGAMLIDANEKLIEVLTNAMNQAIKKDAKLKISSSETNSNSSEAISWHDHIVTIESIIKIANRQISTIQSNQSNMVNIDNAESSLPINGKLVKAENQDLNLLFAKFKAKFQEEVQHEEMEQIESAEEMLIGENAIATEQGRTVPDAPATEVDNDSETVQDASHTKVGNGNDSEENEGEGTVTDAHATEVDNDTEVGTSNDSEENEGEGTVTDEPATEVDNDTEVGTSNDSEENEGEVSGQRRLLMFLDDGPKNVEAAAAFPQILGNIDESSNSSNQSQTNEGKLSNSSNQSQTNEGELSNSSEQSQPKFTPSQIQNGLNATLVSLKHLEGNSNNRDVIEKSKSAIESAMNSIEHMGNSNEINTTGSGCCGCGCGECCIQIQVQITGAGSAQNDGKTNETATLLGGRTINHEVSVNTEMGESTSNHKAEITTAASKSEPEYELEPSVESQNEFQDLEYDKLNSKSKKCDVDNECDPRQYCDKGDRICTMKVRDGEKCSQNEHCISGVCSATEICVPEKKESTLKDEKEKMDVASIFEDIARKNETTEKELKRKKTQETVKIEENDDNDDDDDENNDDDEGRDFAEEADLAKNAVNIVEILYNQLVDNYVKFTSYKPEKSLCTGRDGRKLAVETATSTSTLMTGENVGMEGELRFSETSRHFSTLKSGNKMYGIDCEKMSLEDAIEEGSFDSDDEVSIDNKSLYKCGFNVMFDSRPAEVKSNENGDEAFIFQVKENSKTNEISKIARIQRNGDDSQMGPFEWALQLGKDVLRNSGQEIVEENAISPFFAVTNSIGVNQGHWIKAMQQGELHDNGNTSTLSGTFVMNDDAVMLEATSTPTEETWKNFSIEESFEKIDKSFNLYIKPILILGMREQMASKEAGEILSQVSMILGLHHKKQMQSKLALEAEEIEASDSIIEHIRGLKDYFESYEKTEEALQKSAVKNLKEMTEFAKQLGGKIIEARDARERVKESKPLASEKSFTELGKICTDVLEMLKRPKQSPFECNDVTSGTSISEITPFIDRQKLIMMYCKLGNEKLKNEAVLSKNTELRLKDLVDEIASQFKSREIRELRLELDLFAAKKASQFFNEEQEYLEFNDFFELLQMQHYTNAFATVRFDMDDLKNEMEKVTSITYNSSGTKSSISMQYAQDRESKVYIRLGEATVYKSGAVQAAKDTFNMVTQDDAPIQVTTFALAPIRISRHFLFLVKKISTFDREKIYKDTWKLLKDARKKQGRQSQVELALGALLLLSKSKLASEKAIGVHGKIKYREHKRKRKNRLECENAARSKEGKKIASAKDSVPHGMENILCAAVAMPAQDEKSFIRLGEICSQDKQCESGICEVTDGTDRNIDERQQSATLRRCAGAGSYGSYCMSDKSCLSKNCIRREKKTKEKKKIIPSNLLSGICGRKKQSISSFYAQQSQDTKSFFSKTPVPTALQDLRSTSLTEGKIKLSNTTKEDLAKIIYPPMAPIQCLDDSECASQSCIFPKTEKGQGEDDWKIGFCEESVNRLANGFPCSLDSECKSQKCGGFQMSEFKMTCASYRNEESNHSDSLSNWRANKCDLIYSGDTDGENNAKASHPFNEHFFCGDSPGFGNSESGEDQGIINGAIYRTLLTLEDTITSYGTCAYRCVVNPAVEEVEVQESPEEALEDIELDTRSLLDKQKERTRVDIDENGHSTPYLSLGARVVIHNLRKLSNRSGGKVSVEEAKRQQKYFDLQLMATFPGLLGKETECVEVESDGGEVLYDCIFFLVDDVPVTTGDNESLMTKENEKHFATLVKQSLWKKRPSAAFSSRQFWGGFQLPRQFYEASDEALMQSTRIVEVEDVFRASWYSVCASKNVDFAREEVEKMNFQEVWKQRHHACENSLLNGSFPSNGDIEQEGCTHWREPEPGDEVQKTLGSGPMALFQERNPDGGIEIDDPKPKHFLRCCPKFDSSCRSDNPYIIPGEARQRNIGTTTELRALMDAQETDIEEDRLSDAEDLSTSFDDKSPDFKHSENKTKGSSTIELTKLESRLRSAMQMNQVERSSLEPSAVDFAEHLSRKGIDEVKELPMEHLQKLHKKAQDGLKPDEMIVAADIRQGHLEEAQTAVIADAQEAKRVAAAAASIAASQKKMDSRSPDEQSVAEAPNMEDLTALQRKKDRLRKVNLNMEEAHRKQAEFKTMLNKIGTDLPSLRAEITQIKFLIQQKESGGIDSSPNLTIEHLKEQLEEYEELERKLEAQGKTIQNTMKQQSGVIETYADAIPFKLKLENLREERQQNELESKESKEIKEMLQDLKGEIKSLGTEILDLQTQHRSFSKESEASSDAARFKDARLNHADNDDLIPLKLLLRKMVLKYNSLSGDGQKLPVI